MTTPNDPTMSHDSHDAAIASYLKEPGRRHPSAEALPDDPGRWLRDEPILTRPVGQAEHCGRCCRRNPAISGPTIHSVEASDYLPLE